MLTFRYTKIFDKYIFYQFKTIDDGKSIFAIMYLVDPTSILYRHVMTNLATLNFKYIIKHGKYIGRIVYRKPYYFPIIKKEGYWGNIDIHKERIKRNITIDLDNNYLDNIDIVNELRYKFLKESNLDNGWCNGKPLY